MDTVVDFVQVGATIRRTREQHSMKQKELAEKLGTTATHLSDIERKKHASVEMLVKISNILDTPVDNLLKGNPWICKSYTMDSDILPLLKEFAPQSMNAVREMLEAMLKFQRASAQPEAH